MMIKKLLAVLAVVGMFAMGACDLQQTQTCSQGGNTPTNNQPVDSGNTINPPVAP